MKLLAKILMIGWVVTSLSVCKAQQAHTNTTEQGGSAGASQAASTKTIMLDMTNVGNIKYTGLTEGFARSKDIFNIQVTNYNPLRYKITATGTVLVTFQNSSSPLLSYVAITTPAAKTGTTPGAEPMLAAGLATADVQSLQAIVTDLTGKINDMNKDMRAVSGFICILAAYQNDIDSWKKMSLLAQSTVNSRKQTAYDQLGRLINAYYPNVVNNPYQPALGNATPYTIATYIISDFPLNVINDLKDKFTAYKTSLTNLATFETVHAAQINALAQAVAVPDYAGYKKDVNDNSALIQKYISDYDGTQNSKITQFQQSDAAISVLEYTTQLGPFSLQGNDDLTIKIAKTDMATNTDEWSGFPGILIRRQGGVKIDFSAGLFFSTLSDRSYVASQSTHITQDSVVNNGAVSVQPNQTTFSKITQRGGSNVSYGPMAFIHFHSMNTGLLNYGVFVGTGFMFKDDAKPVLAFGGNLMLVNYQRIILGFGGAVGSVTRLSSKYQEGGSYRESITDVATENHLDFKLMFSLSWNLSK